MMIEPFYSSRIKGICLCTAEQKSGKYGVVVLLLLVLVRTQVGVV